MGKDKRLLKIMIAALLMTLLAVAMILIHMTMSGDVVIDAGHGGSDPGAIYGDISEKDVNLEIARKVKNDLKRSGFHVVMTRNSDEFIGLYERAGISNRKKAKIFVSIHCNAADNGSAAGIEIYTMKGSDEGKKLAETVRKPLLNETGAKDLGVKQGNLAVLRATECPAILIESGFLSNDNERWMLSSDEYQNRIAKGISDGVKTYLRAEMID